MESSETNLLYEQAMVGTEEEKLLAVENRLDHLKRQRNGLDRAIARCESFIRLWHEVTEACAHAEEAKDE